MFTQPRVLHVPDAVAGEGRAYVARAALWLRSRVAPGEQLVLAAPGLAAEHLPALSVAVRALGAPAVEYRLIDALALPAPGAEWPDAPVVFMLTATADDASRALATQARLRGWLVEG